MVGVIFLLLVAAACRDEVSPGGTARSLKRQHQVELGRTTVGFEASKGDCKREGGGVAAVKSLEVLSR